MLPTRNDLPLATRQSMADALNATLADLIDLNIQCKSAHWNVKGLQFASLHALFEAIADEAAELADEVAERAVTLGGIAESSLATVAKRTRMPSYNESNLSSHSCLSSIAAALATLASHARKDIDMAAEMGDAVTADLYTGLVRAIDKRLWFVEAHLQQGEA